MTLPTEDKGQAGKRRAENILIGRCRHGDEEALAILVYRLAPALWAAALRRNGEEPSAACLRGWAAVLAALRGWRWYTVARLADIARRAIGAAVSEVGASEPPPGVVAAMIDAAHSASQELAEASARRSFWRLQGYAMMMALVLGAVMMLATYKSMGTFGRTPPAELAALQFRIRHAALSTRLRDIAWDLPPPAEGRSVAAQVLTSAALALDEIASVPLLRAGRLRYVAWRIVAGDLPSNLRQLAQTLPESRRGAVLDAALALEEVQTWFSRP